MSRDGAKLIESSLMREQVEKLKIYERLVVEWSRVKNLVSHSARDQLWTRHILDSVQVQLALPRAKVWADLGSGGGFPGLVTAILLGGREGTLVHLVESDGRKCAFLRAVSRETGCRTQVWHERIEDVVPQLSDVEAVSARALAELDVLLGWSASLINQGAVGVFLKGKDVHRELTAIPAESNFRIELRRSAIEESGALAIVRSRGPHRDHV